MGLKQAIEQLKKIRENLNKANIQHISQETIMSALIEFKLKSMEAIDRVLEEVEGK